MARCRPGLRCATPPHDPEKIDDYLKYDGYQVPGKVLKTMALMSYGRRMRCRAVAAAPFPTGKSGSLRAMFKGQK